MATLLDLVQQQKLHRLDPQLEPGLQEVRRIYLTPRMGVWVQDVLPGLEADGHELSPAEQLFALVEVFCAGKPLAFGWQFKLLHHREAGIWELKTPDLRIFGWFQMPDCFVADSGDLATRIKEVGLYAGYRDQAVRFRDALDLDPPKFVPGEDPNDVVSNCYQPQAPSRG